MYRGPAISLIAAAGEVRESEVHHAAELKPFIVNHVAEPEPFIVHAPYC